MSLSEAATDSPDVAAQVKGFGDSDPEVES